MTFDISQSINLYRYLVVIFGIGVAITLLCEIRRIRSVYFIAIALIAFLYPLGKFFQFWLIGPRWIRWYMSDVGFISGIGIAIAYSPFKFFGNTMLERIRSGLGTSFRLAVVVEILQLIAKPYITKKQTFMASGDWVDMAIFFVMYAVNLYLLAKLKKQCEPVVVTRPIQKSKKRNAQFARR